MIGRNEGRNASVFDTSETYESHEELSYVAEAPFEGSLVGGPRAIFDEEIEDGLIGSGYYAHSFTYPARAEAAATEAGYDSVLDAIVALFH